MKHRFLSFLVGLVCYTVATQAAAPPSYYSVLHYFIQNYDPRLDQYATVSFAKKPDGWYVQVLDYETIAANPRASYSKEYLFWSKAREQFVPLEVFPDGQASKEHIDQFWRNALAPWYDMNRNLYYGYNGWEIDVIRELSTRSNLNDTLRESLARAYGNYAHRYLWYQTGGDPIGTDTLQQKRALLAVVPEAAADSAAAYVRKSVAQYRLLAARNPWYPTLVGAVSTKVNNELMFAWQFLQQSGYPDKAAPFLREVHFDSSQIRIAQALLAECPPNTILITYGDNDSYQLWYVQQAMGYRKDVSVVNVSLLGTPQYLNWLKQSKTVDFSLHRNSLARSDFNYLHIGASEHPEKRSSRMVKSVPQLLSYIATAAPSTDLSTAVFTADSLYIPVPTHAALWKSWPIKPVSISPALKRYYVLSDLLLLDIVSNNIAKRPLYFTAQEDELFKPYQLDYGMSYQLIPSQIRLATDTISLRRMHQVLAHEADFMPSYRGADNQANGALVRLLNMHIALGGYYNEKEDSIKKAKHLNAAIRLTEQHYETSGTALFYTGYYLIHYRHDIGRGQRYIQDFLQRYVANSQHYTNALWPPDADNGDQYYSLANDLYMAHNLPTAPLETTWNGRKLK